MANIASSFAEKLSRRAWTTEPQLDGFLAFFTIPVSGSTAFYDGQALGRDINGNIVQMDDTLKAEFVGFETDVAAPNYTTVFSTDTIGDKRAKIHRPYAFVALIAAAVAGQEGKKVWWLYNNQVAYSGLTNWNFAGTILGVLDATHVLVLCPWCANVTLGGDKGWVPITGNVTLTKWDVTKAQVCNSTGAMAITLPLSSQCSPGDAITFINVNAASGTPTVGVTGSDKINGGTSYTGSTTQYAQWTMRTDGNGNWYTVTPNASGTLGATTFTGAISVSGAIVGTDAAAGALAIGANGATNPVLTVDASAGSVATGLDIIGKAAGSGVTLQAISSTGGEALALLGGASTTSTAGGAVNITGAIGGATTGAGGAVVIAGGAGTAGNSAGGAVSGIGGAGQGSAAGGLGKIGGGVGGTTGAGGAAQVIGGAGGATSGTGGAVTITAGAAVGTSAVGGAVNILSGASAGASGTAGAVTIDTGSAAGGTGAAITIGASNATAVNIGVATTITSNSATALAVGPNGTTNPVLTVVGSTSSAKTGVSVTGAAAGSGVALAATSNATNEAMTLDAKGSSILTLASVSTGGCNVRAAVKTVAATGTAIGNAAALAEGFQYVTAANNSAAVILPAGSVGMRVEVVNAVYTATLQVFPQVNNAINNLANNAVYNCPNGGHRVFTYVAAGQWYTDPQTIV
jgi:hypothetical protein